MRIYTLIACIQAIEAESNENVSQIVIQNVCGYPMHHISFMCSEPHIELYVPHIW